MPIDRSLIMMHLHHVDKTYCVQREENKYNAAKIRSRKEESDLGIVPGVSLYFPSETA